MDYSRTKDLVLDLARTRAEKAYAKEEISRIEAEIASTPLGRELAIAKAYLAAAEGTDKKADTALRKAALAEYNTTLNKHPHSAVTIKIFTVLKYDAEAAIMEAIEHFRWTLKLDKRKFDRIAKDADFPFVTKRVDPRVSVARDLSSYLEAWQDQIDLTEAIDLTEGKAESDFVADVFASSPGGSDEQRAI